MDSLPSSPSALRAQRLQVVLKYLLLTLSTIFCASHGPISASDPEQAVGGGTGGRSRDRSGE